MTKQQIAEAPTGDLIVALVRANIKIVKSVAGYSDRPGRVKISDVKEESAIKAELLSRGVLSGDNIRALEY